MHVYFVHTVQLADDQLCLASFATEVGELCNHAGEKSRIIICK